MLKNLTIASIIVLSLVFFCTKNIFALKNNIIVTDHIKVDQFGYQNNDEKIAIISNPQIGYNANLSFNPGYKYQVRNWKTNKIEFSGTTTKWKNGEIHDQSGDKVWWFDFSNLTKTGSYYIYDIENNVKSGRFEINDKIYNNILKVAMRMFYYQRAGFEKNTQFAKNDGFTDKASHLQDKNCKYYDLTKNMPIKDLTGGWYDAGDYNKYVNYVWDPILDLLISYEQKPQIWLDNYGIPESNNGIPDILDEVKYELDWLLKMQNTDGSVLSLVGTNNYEQASPPSADLHDRFYGPATTQATFAAAGMFALASIEYKSINPEYSILLKNSAINAWKWANNNPNIIFHNNNKNTGYKNSDNMINFLAAGDQESENPEWSTARKKFVSAVYLFAITGENEYTNYVDNYFTNEIPSTIGISSGLVPEADALLYYTKTKGATNAIKNEILKQYENSIKNGVSNYPTVSNKIDAYRAYISDYNWDTKNRESIHDWGSNVVKAKQALLFLNMNQYNIDIKNNNKYYNAASGFLHYFHGVNPNSKVYLTNMSKYGAENSVTSIYHAWFGKILPPPGYIPGGPNQNYKKNDDCYTQYPPEGCTSNTSDPEGQPAQKSWKDFGDAYPLDSWTVTEPQIFSQAAYIRLISNFVK